MKHNIYNYLILENVVEVCEGIIERMKKFPNWKSIGFCIDVYNAIEKIKNHQFLKNKSRIFACCDISGLDIDIRDLRGFSRAKYGFDLVIRDKDSGFYFKESSIKNAAFDFMLCLSFDAYVGLSRSTFSNLLCVTKSILSEKSFDHYVYDSGRSFVERRIDAGLEADPEKSTSLSFSIR